MHPARDAHGNIKRSSYQVHLFKIKNPCPATGYFSTHCPGYVVDHVVPLCACGADRPGNMQWQTVAEAKERTASSGHNAKESVMEIETERRIALLESAVIQLQQEVMKLMRERQPTLPPAPAIPSIPPWYPPYEVTSMTKEGGS